MPAKKKTVKKKTTANNKKLAELEKKNEELELSLNQLNEKYIKLLAEFDNYQRRTIEEKDKQRKFQSMDIIKDLLPVFDDIGRTIDSDDFKSEKKYLDPIYMINSKSLVYTFSNWFINNFFPVPIWMDRIGNYNS